tara:strand:- start:256 stop:903 length:648 start_codon:yes stop_codon:yes gene_type:complete
MIKKIKASLSEKILFIFLILLIIVSFSSFFILKNKCIFVDQVNIENLKFKKPENIIIMEIECGSVVIELYPETSPNAVRRFKMFIENGSYNGSTFYRVAENTFVQAGDIEFGNIKNLNYSKIGTGKSGYSTIDPELEMPFDFLKGSVAFAGSSEKKSVDSEFFITLSDIPIYEGEYTPLGKVIHGLEALKKIKTGNKSLYVLKPDFIYNLKLLVN